MNGYYGHDKKTVCLLGRRHFLGHNILQKGNRPQYADIFLKDMPFRILQKLKFREIFFAQTVPRFRSMQF